MDPRPHGQLCRALAALAMISATASPVRAWTEANVRTVQAHVEVDSDGAALVAMELTVQIHGGWLEGLEITVPDRDFQLVVEKPPWAASMDEAGNKFRVRSSVARDGRLQLSFGRREAPRRGVIRVGLVYTTDLGHRATRPLYDGNVRVEWTLPGWRSGLDGVSISLSVPPGALPVEVRSADRDAVETRQVALSDRVLVQWHRAHLPRTVSWTVEMDLPEAQVAPSLRAPRVERRPVSAPTVDRASAREGLFWTGALALSVALLCLVGGITFHHRCRGLGCRPRPLVPMPMAVRVLLTPSLAAAGLWVCSAAPSLEPLALLALPALWMQRTPSRTGGAPMLGAWRPATRSDLRLARRETWSRRFGARLPIDITTPVGVVVLATVGLGLWSWARLAGIDLDELALASGALVAVPFLTATRLLLPSSAAARLDAARALAERAPTTATPVALRLVVHASTDRCWQDCRLRLTPSSPPDGLHAFDLVLADRRVSNGYDLVLVVLALTSRESPADTAVAGSLPEAEAVPGPGHRIARTLALPSGPWPAVERILAALAGARSPESVLKTARVESAAA